MKASYIEVWKDNNASAVHLLDIEKMRIRKASRPALEDAANIARFLMSSCRSDSVELLLAGAANLVLPYGSSQEDRQEFINKCLTAFGMAENWDRS